MSWHSQPRRRGLCLTTTLAHTADGYAVANFKRNMAPQMASSEQSVIRGLASSAMSSCTWGCSCARTARQAAQWGTKCPWRPSPPAPPTWRSKESCAGSRGSQPGYVPAVRRAGACTSQVRRRAPLSARYLLSARSWDRITNWHEAGLRSQKIIKIKFWDEIWNLRSPSLSCRRSISFVTW